MIEISHLNKIYKSKKRRKCHALKDINLTLPDNGLVFVLGKSGSGKSTLLNLIGGLDNITSGSITVDGNNLSKFREKAFCNYRNTHIGFIFQDYHLIDELTVYDNIALSLNLRRIKDKEAVSKALAKVDLAGYEDRYPTELSGGEQQRVAIARAIVKKPRIILADEPTGNLDTNTATAIVTLLKELSKECLILIVSHNVNDANNYADRIIELRKGEIIADKSRNPAFLDEMSLLDGKLIYPQGLQLSDRDIAFMNENTGAKFIKKTDKFIPTILPEKEAKKVKIENRGLSFFRKLRLSGKFLKSKTFAIFTSAMMVAIIMVVMAVAQTIITFTGEHIITKEMAKSNQTSLLMNKILPEETQALLSEKYLVSINESDITAFYNSGYQGTIYPVYNHTVSISSFCNAWGLTGKQLNGVYMHESFGTMIVDNSFLSSKFGTVKYAAKADTIQNYGITITDYVADSILLYNTKYQGKTYVDLLGEYYYSGFRMPSNYINAIIDTGYKQRHQALFDLISNNTLSAQELYENEAFQSFSNEVYDRLGYCYTGNSDFISDLSDSSLICFAPHYKLVFNDVTEYTTRSFCYALYADPSVFSDLKPLPARSIRMNIKKYNEIFGTNYTSSNLDTFIPHKVTLTHYDYNDVDNSHPLFSMEVTIVGLDAGILRTMDVPKDIYDLFLKDNYRVYSLYFNGTEGAGMLLDTAETLHYEHQSYAIEGIHTMTKVVDTFVPIFELVVLFLCAGVIFVLVNFSSKMIGDKMHEIGILKALGAKNGTIGVVFGLQVFLIALLTCILATVGYYYLIDIANDLLIESLHRFAKKWVVIDLAFLTFKPEIAVFNCLLTAALAVVSLIFPMLKIKAIKPVKIIKAKE